MANLWLLATSLFWGAVITIALWSLVMLVAGALGLEVTVTRADDDASGDTPRADLSASIDSYHATAMGALGEIVAERDAALARADRAARSQARLQRALAAVRKVLEAKHGESPEAAAQRLWEERHEARVNALAAVEQTAEVYERGSSWAARMVRARDEARAEVEVMRKRFAAEGNGAPWGEREQALSADVARLQVELDRARTSAVLAMCAEQARELACEDAIRTEEPR